jgi:alanine dehydrogenase
VAKLRQGAVIVDASCDEGMGFPFSMPTSFAEPMFPVAGINYYAVDHTPSYLWRSASWEISAVVVSYLETIMGGLAPAATQSPPPVATPKSPIPELI